MSPLVHLASLAPLPCCSCRWLVLEVCRGASWAKVWRQWLLPLLQWVCAWWRSECERSRAKESATVAAPARTTRTRPNKPSNHSSCIPSHYRSLRSAERRHTQKRVSLNPKTISKPSSSNRTESENQIKTVESLSRLYGATAGWFTASWRCWFACCTHFSVTVLEFSPL